MVYHARRWPANEPPHPDSWYQGDTRWIGIPLSFAVSEMLTLQGNLVYAVFDGTGEGFEISGSTIYAISDGASVDLDIGLLFLGRS